MTFGDTIRNLIDRMLKNSIIVSPRFSDYRVQDVIPVQDIGVDEHFKSEVVRIIQEEITIQMTAFREDPPNTTRKSKPEDSALTKVQGDISEVMGIVKNPGGFVGGALRVLPPVAIAFLAKEVSGIVLDELTKEGGVLDLRWKRELDKETNAFLDRQQQRNTQIGLRQVIATSEKGFIKINGAGGTESNTRQIKDGGVDGTRLARTGLVDHAKGLVP